MTLKQIIESDKPFLTPAEVAEVLGACPQTIRNQAHDYPEKLGFPVIVTGSRTRIPRIRFLEFIGIRCDI